MTSLVRLRNPDQWHQPPADLYARTLDQIASAEALGFDSVWTAEHHFTDDGYLPSTLCSWLAAARTAGCGLALLFSCSLYTIRYGWRSVSGARPDLRRPRFGGRCGAT